MQKTDNKLDRQQVVDDYLTMKSFGDICLERFSLDSIKRIEYILRECVYDHEKLGLERPDILAIRDFLAELSSNSMPNFAAIGFEVTLGKKQDNVFLT